MSQMQFVCSNTDLHVRQPNRERGANLRILCRGFRLVSAMVKLLKDAMMYCVGESPNLEGNVHRDVEFTGEGG